MRPSSLIGGTLDDMQTHHLQDNTQRHLSHIHKGVYLSKIRSKGRGTNDNIMKPWGMVGHASAPRLLRIIQVRGLLVCKPK